MTKTLAALALSAAFLAGCGDGGAKKQFEATNSKIAELEAKIAELTTQQQALKESFAAIDGTAFKSFQVQLPAYAYDNQTVELIGAEEGFCFPSKISADFTGAGEQIRTEVQNGKWVLATAAVGGSVQGAATCIVFGR